MLRLVVRLRAPMHSRQQLPLLLQVPKSASCGSFRVEYCCILVYVNCFRTISNNIEELIDIFDLLYSHQKH